MSTYHCKYKKCSAHFIQKIWKNAIDKGVLDNVLYYDLPNQLLYYVTSYVDWLYYVTWYWLHIKHYPAHILFSPMHHYRNYATRRKKFFVSKTMKLKTEFDSSERGVKTRKINKCIRIILKCEVERNGSADKSCAKNKWIVLDHNNGLSCELTCTRMWYTIRQLFNNLRVWQLKTYASSKRCLQWPLDLQILKKKHQNSKQKTKNNEKSFRFEEIQKCAYTVR